MRHVLNKGMKVFPFYKGSLVRAVLKGMNH